MCFSTIYSDFKGRQKEVMGDGAQVKAKDDGFPLIDLMREERFVQGRIKRIDFVDKHSMVLEKR